MDKTRNPNPPSAVDRAARRAAHAHVALGRLHAAQAAPLRTPGGNSKMDMTWPVTLDEIPPGPDLREILADLHAAGPDEWCALRAEAPYPDAPQAVQYRAALHAPMTWADYARSGLTWDFAPVADLRGFQPDGRPWQEGAIDRARRRWNLHVHRTTDIAARLAAELRLHPDTLTVERVDVRGDDGRARAYPGAYRPLHMPSHMRFAGLRRGPHVPTGFRWTGVPQWDDPAPVQAGDWTICFRPDGALSAPYAATFQPM